MARPCIDKDGPTQNVYNHAWLPIEAIRRREEKIKELEEHGIELLYLPKEGSIPLTKYGRGG